MNYDAFMGQVQHRAKLAGGGEAERAVRATLETLAERLPAAAAEHFAAQLPHEVGQHLRREAEHFERMSLHDFYAKVAERENCKLADAAYHARVVMELAIEAVSPGATAKLLSMFPEEFTPLFAGSQGHAT